MAMARAVVCLQVQSGALGVIHPNSAAAYNEERKKLSKRALLVCAWVEIHGPATDRQIMLGLGYTDMNAVRPRITESVDAGQLVELRSTRCSVTGKSVRVVGRPVKQMELLAA